MKRLFISLTILFVLAFNSAHAVKIEFHEFKDKKQEQLYLQLIAELRCVKCQNQNLAESNAELATDMREKAYDMVVKGKSRQDVVNYMTARYGDFVLYKPPFKTQTWLLWIGPALLLILSLFFLIRRIRSQEQKTVETLNKNQRESVRDLLKK